MPYAIREDERDEKEREGLLNRAFSPFQYPKKKNVLQNFFLPSKLTVKFQF
jgi:hypothetical protein